MAERVLEFECQFSPAAIATVGGVPNSAAVTAGLCSMLLLQSSSSIDANGMRPFCNADDVYYRARSTMATVMDATRTEEEVEVEPIQLLIGSRDGKVRMIEIEVSYNE